MAYRKRGNSFLVDVTVAGKRRYKTVKTEAEARLVEVQTQVAMEQGEMGDGTPPPVSVGGSSWTLKRAYEETLKVHWLGTKSEDFWKRQSGYLIAHFGENMPLGKITTAQVDDLRAELQERKLAQSSINHYLVTLSMIFKIAHQRGGVAMKPVLGIKKVKRGRIRWVSAQEEKSCLALLTQWGKEDMRDWFIFLIDTGMRPSESKKVSGRDVEERTGMVHIWESKTQAGVRGVPMTGRVREIVLRRVASRCPTDMIFPYPWQTFTECFGRLRDALKLAKDSEFVPYCLRHTFATRLVQRGIRIEVIKNLLGHESITQTMQYAHVGAHQYVEAIKALEQVGSA